MTDYCDTCKEKKELLSRNQAVTNRLKQSGSAPAEELERLQSERRKIDEELAQHRDDANKSREYHKQTITKCRQQWEKISALHEEKKNLSETESEKLEELQHCFTLAVSADYQQSKLIPSWGSSEQPGSTYMLQKVSHDIFGVVDHRQEKSAVFIFDERLGPKNTDHTFFLDNLRGESNQ